MAAAAAAVAAINARAVGLAGGRRATAPPSDLFVAANVPGNLAALWRWTRGDRRYWCVPPGWRRSSGAGGAARGAATGGRPAPLVVGVLVSYLPYALFDEWWYLRFYLPAWPVARRGGATVAWRSRRAGPTGRAARRAGRGARRRRRTGAQTLPRPYGTFDVVARRAALSRSSAAFAVDRRRRDTLRAVGAAQRRIATTRDAAIGRWDYIAPDALDRVLREARRRRPRRCGWWPTTWKRRRSARASPAQRRGALDWAPVAEARVGTARARIYDLTTPTRAVGAGADSASAPARTWPWTRAIAARRRSKIAPVTRWRAPLVPVLACLVVGAAGWASRAVLDEVVVDGVRQRIALVPSWHAISRVPRRWARWPSPASPSSPGGRAPPRPLRVRDAVLPVFGLTAIVVPVSAGRARLVAGTAGAGRAGRMDRLGVGGRRMLGWTLAPHAPAAGRVVDARRPAHADGGHLAGDRLAASAGAARLTHTMLFPSGDEPHYLVMAQSLWRDGDLKIENNHTRGDYAEYFGRDLDPHYLTRGDGQRDLLGAPGGHAGADRAGLRRRRLRPGRGRVHRDGRHRGDAWRGAGRSRPRRALGTTTLAWAAIVFSAPFLINTFTIYPEVPAGLAVAVGLALALRPVPDHRPWHDVVIGVMAAALPWLSTKYAPMSAALIAVTLGRRGLADARERNA